jgi:ADP-ribose pyrophosphatase
MQSFKDWTRVFDGRWWVLWERDDWFAVTTSKVTAGAAGLLRDQNGDVVLVKIFRSAVNQVTLELPRGGADEGEHHVEAARREIEEETGLDLSKAKAVDLGNMHPDSGIVGFDLGLAFFEYPGVFPETFDYDPEEVLGVVKMPWDTLVQEVSTGALPDAPTGIAVLRVLTRGL